MSRLSNHNDFIGLGPLNISSFDLDNQSMVAGYGTAFTTGGFDVPAIPPFDVGHEVARKYSNGSSSQFFCSAYNGFDPHRTPESSNPQNELHQPQATFSSSDTASSIQAISSSPHGDVSTEPSSPAFSGQLLSSRAQRILDSLPESTRKSVGWHPQLDRMLAEHPHFIPTFDFASAMSMTGRDEVNIVSGPLPPVLIPEDQDLEELRNRLGIDPTTTTCEQLAAMGHEYLDMLVQYPKIAEVLEQYHYEPCVGPETISQILPNVAEWLKKTPELLDYYQVPLRKGDSQPQPGEGEEEEEEPINEDNEEEDTSKPKSKKKGNNESKYFPRKVQYGPYQYRFKTAEEARNHRKKVRHPPKIAQDIDRVEKYGRYYWTKRIYEAMINVDLIFDNKASVIATNFSKLHHFKEEDLEATAHHVFDACIAVHRRGWYGYDYNRRNFKRGKLRDIFPETIEGRLERVCGILKHCKAIANDCVQGGDLLQQTVDNPIYRASTKTANNKGNLDRARRLRKQETERQREKREAREREKAERARAAAEKKAEKERQAAERKAEKKSQKTEAAVARRTY